MFADKDKCVSTPETRGDDVGANIMLAGLSFIVGIVLAVVLGNALWLLVAALVGAIVANRSRA